MKEADEKYQYWLNTIEGIGKRKIEKLLNIKRTAKGIYEAGPSLIEELDFLTNKDKTSIIDAMHKSDVDADYRKLTEMNIRFLSIANEGYPDKLKKISDPPSALYAIGEVPKANVPTVAVVGARQCSEYGRYVARALGVRLAQEGFQVVSGLARGIDSEAQRAALEAGGKVFGVLGCGVDVCYPRESRKIYEQMKVRGGILSEYPPRTEPKAGLFPMRNRIISGLSDVVVVVEAKEKSGTLITVDMALEQGKEVYAIPGRVTDPLSVGCNHLIKQGAGSLNDLNEFIDDIKRIGLCQQEKKKNDVNRKSCDEVTEKTRKHREERGSRDEKAEEKVEPGTYARELDNIESPFREVGKEIVNCIYCEPKTLQQIYNVLSVKYNVELAELAELLYEMEKVYILHKKDSFYFLNIKKV